MIKEYFVPALVVAATATCIGTGFIAYNSGARSARLVAENTAFNVARAQERKIEELRTAGLEAKTAFETSINAIEKKHLEERENDKKKADATIAAYRSDNLQLQDRFAKRTCPASGVGSAKATAGVAGDNAAQSVGLQDADVEFLVRFADDADQVADGLRACQGVVTRYQEFYRKTWPDAAKAILDGPK
jgi:hypothetical protein